MGGSGRPFFVLLCYKDRVLNSAKASFRLARNTFRILGQAEAMQLAAALSFYAIFSLAPLLLLVMMVGGAVLGPAAARGELVGTMQVFVGERVAGAIQAILASTARNAPVSAGVVGVVVLLLAASGVFGQLKAALNRIWSAGPRKGRHWILVLIRDRVVAALATVVVILFLIVCAVLTSVLGTAERLLLLPDSFTVWRLFNFGVSLALLTALIGTIFRFVPDKRPPRRNLWAGALLSAIALSCGHALIGLYLRHTRLLAGYGAAGSFIVIVVWVYLTSLAIFLGAAFARAESMKAPRRKGGAG